MSKSESEKTFDPDNFIKEGSILNSSKLFKFYQLLDEQKDTNNNISASDDDDNDDDDGDDEQKKHLAELKKHLKNIFIKWDGICKSTDDYKIKCSEYLKYWLYGKIAEKKLKFFRIRELNKYLKELMEKKLSIINENDCRKNFIKCAPIEVLHNKKILYDFLEYYIYLKDKLSKIDENVKGKYCKYITHIFELYHKLYEEDRQWGLSYRYEKELNLFRTTFTNESALSSLKSKCNIDNLLIKSFKDVKKTDMLEENQFRGRATSNRSDNNFTNIKSENIIKELPSSNIYDELSKGDSNNEYKGKRCDNLNVNNNNMKDICKKMAKNIKTLRNNSKMNDLSHRDRCTYLNFWIYEEISKLRKNEDTKLTDITDVANLIDINIKINKDLIKDDFDVNYKAIVPETAPSTSTPTLGTGNSQANGGAGESLKNGETTPPNINEGGEESKKNIKAGGSAENGGTEGSKNNEELKKPTKFVKYYELSKHKPCYFNYDCKFSECREMKYLYEYFKDYETIKKKINCGQGRHDKYYKYLTYINYLYNKHKNEKGCCSWGAEICPDYFLSCDEYYNPNEIVTTIESGDIETCNKILEVPVPEKSKDVPSVDLNSGENMYIKYFTCSYVTDSKFEKKGLRCQQPGYSAHLNDKISARRNVIKPQNNTSGLDGKKIIVNGKTINVVLISDPYAKTTGKDGTENSMPNDNYTLFPEIRGAARKAYVKQAKEACKKGEIKKGMEEYCRKSERYNKIINLSNSQPANLTLKEDIENWEDIAIPDDTSFLSEILQQLPVRMGAVSLASLGAITMLFMYYKFTPLGSWLRNAMGGKKKMEHGNHREPRKSLNYQQDHMPQISQKKRIKIAYQSS